MSNSFPGAYFVDGGTLRADTPSYVNRPADDELFDALIDREYCYILTPRQMGKSSLMIRTSQRLKEHNVKTATVDIQGIGTNRVREWYASLLSQIRRGLKLSADIDQWMEKKSNVGFGQLFMDFIQDVVLTEIPEQIIIFLDEVDWMIKIDFRDDFFASIRSMYNARPQYSEFNRISFVLLGVASPADLISEPTRTPFNIGHAIPLQELSLEDATPLQDGLEQVYPGEGRRILERIFYWTNGHPYLSQKICKTIVETNRAGWSDDDVDQLVHRLFLSEESRKEANLKFIQDRILSNEQSGELLKLYKLVLRSREREKGQSIRQIHLMLSGLVVARNGFLEVRNRIYRTVFNDRWISQNAPKNWPRIALVGLGTVFVLLMSIFIYDFTVGMRLDSHTVDFYASASPEQRLANLAHIYRLRGVLSNTNTGLSASQLFYGLQREDQLAMFKSYSRESDPKWQDDLLVVVKQLYVTVAYVDPENDNTELLQTMQNSVNKIGTTPESKGVIEEISFWLDGRQSYLTGNYEQALEDYGQAISLHQQNPATVYERALVYIALADYQNALEDLDTTISLAKESTQQDEIDLTPIVTATVNLPPTLALGGPTIGPIDPSILTAPSWANNVFLTPSAVSFTPTPQPTRSNARLESNFSTYIEIVNAVKTLIDKTPGLQNAIQSNGDVAYSNLQLIGLVALASSEGMVQIASGTYEVGTTAVTDEFHVAPLKTTLNSYWIDKYQITNVQYQQFLDETGGQTPAVWPGENNHPVSGVTWDQAAAYCSWAKKRLPTEAEWEAAGRGPGDSPQLYPWGTDPTAGGNTSNLPDQDTYAVGSLAFNQSLLGVFDLVGNVWEWTGEPYSPVQDGYKVLRGGRFGLLLDLAYRLPVPPDDTRYIIYAGFRCAADQVK